MANRNKSNLEEEVAKMVVNGTLPTPTARDWKNGCSKEGQRWKRKEEQGWTIELNDLAANNLLPTPTAIEGVKWTNTWNPNSQMGQSLSAMAGSGMLPTPVIHGDQYEEAVRAVDNMVAGGLLNTPVGDGLKCRTTHHGQRRMNGVALEKLNEHLTGTKSAPGGESSRLSPLFTEEMMGFPYRHTTMPFSKQEITWIEIV
jgi:hypothetical protein